MKQLTEGVHTAAYRKILIPLFLLLFPLITTAQTSVPEEVSNADKIAELSTGLNTVWMLLAAMLVFFMQPGFALVEAGFTRSKNTANILMKNLVDFMVGSILFWFIGFGLMFGIGDVFGTPHLFDLDAMSNIIQNGLPIEGFLIFQTVFCATSATIVSGAMAERTKFSMYLAYTIAISVLIYPVSGHWTWGGGWLSNADPDSFMMSVFGYTFHDFAGSTVVHSVGGWIALVGAAILGPRLGKYGKDGKSKAIPGHNLTLACLGVFILWFGWFGFNPGSQLAAAGYGDQTAISHVFLTTNLAACTGGFLALLVSWIKYGKPSLSLTLNGILAGLVGVTAGCDLVSPMGAALIGAICGTVMIFAVEFIEHRLKIDDPVGASSVHGVCGSLGTILTGLFAVEGGTFYGGGFGFLGAQIFGVIIVGGWAALMGYIIFKVLDKVHGLRVPARIEEEGLDIYEHGESAYNH
ncbi:ammonium transporter [Phocaeicola plebeius]|mgnify:FL=1|jgi:Amt family ammonium transporter|uniref:Ammonium transporter n=1 Tax=Phocaeicola plebeius TaxID=310297 RepID=A0A3E4W5Y2_9BACT|nr:ammonium transporter [Phocaeicola plebeius]HBV18790.1 ammonium transporter [Bacteroides sp.]MBD9352357.1 ammonium transporter [Phocaeicola plebeius]RGK57564.1 ammonium transporter [Phocaeicola plebeius]RGM37605.1 ammonium transporter [Phocaeicola plebeius]RGQ72092.1 ammonium transporter [Phocaeicola plebeius]